MHLVGGGALIYYHHPPENFQHKSTKISLVSAHDTYHNDLKGINEKTIVKGEVHNYYRDGSAKKYTIRVVGIITYMMLAFFCNGIM